MNIQHYLDSTYLKTPEQAGVSEVENNCIVQRAIQEAIEEGFKLIMLRPNKVKMARELILKANSSLLVGTVVSFPEGNNSLESKMAEAQQAIEDGVDELDFVCNYEAFKKGELSLFKEEIIKGTELALNNYKTVKWIIEVAALTDFQIIQISTLIKNTILSNFKENCYSRVFVKSSTGFYKTQNNLPNGATVSSVVIMLENAWPLPVKAAGGVRSYEEALEMIRLGVKRIGTSAAKEIVRGGTIRTNY